MVFGHHHQRPMHSETGVPRIAAPVEQFLDALATVVQTGLQKVHRLRPTRVWEDAKVFTRIPGSMQISVIPIVRDDHYFISAGFVSFFTLAMPAGSA